MGDFFSDNVLEIGLVALGLIPSMVSIAASRANTSADASTDTGRFGECGNTGG